MEPDTSNQPSRLVAVSPRKCGRCTDAAGAADAAAELATAVRNAARYARARNSDARPFTISQSFIAAIGSLNGKTLARVF